MVTLRHITAAEVRNEQREREREREREIKREREREGKEPQPKEREENIIGFDTATSSFLTLLISKSYKKTEEGKIKEKVLNSKIKKIKIIFCFENSVK